MPRAPGAGQLFWLAPFACIGLITLATLRPPPVFPTPLSSRIVTDAKNARVPIPLPLKGVVGSGSDYLEITHAPEMLLKAGKPLDRSRFATGLMSHIYPRVLKDDALWDAGDWTLESVLAHDVGGVYFHYDSELFRGFGLPAVTLAWKSKTRDEMIFSAVRVANATLGQSERGGQFAEGYRRGFADLKQELRPETLQDRPRVLGMGSSKTDWRQIWVTGPETTKWEQQEERIGVRNAAEFYMNKGRQEDAERILAMDPDIISEFGETVPDFLRDPRWQGLKALRNRRVYQGPRDLEGSLAPMYGLDVGPLWARWLAEVAHPDRLEPKLRDMLRDHYRAAYGYRLGDDEIDSLLRVDQNRSAAGYARFLKDDSATDGQRAGR